MLKTKKINQRGFAHLLGILLIVVLFAIGSIGFFVYKKHQGKTAAHASSLAYKYGAILRNDKYATIYACRYYNQQKQSFNEVSVFTVRNAKINNHITSIDVWMNANPAWNTITHKYNASWWYGTLSLIRLSTVANGHNYIGYASANLDIYGNGSSGGGGRLTVRGAPGQSSGLSYVTTVTGGIVVYPGSWGGKQQVATRTLPACHY